MADDNGRFANLEGNYDLAWSKAMRLVAPELGGS